MDSPLGGRRLEPIRRPMISFMSSERGRAWKICQQLAVDPPVGGR
jgi:hypothetical protein